MSYGYAGKILHADLSRQKITVETPDEAFYRRYMGGSAQNLYYLLREMSAGADPLGPENILCLSVGVITGAPISGNSRVTASAKSPLTGAIGDSQAGGYWPAQLKRAGFDGIIIKGRAPSPMYLWIHDGQAELRDASHLWGKITGEAEAQIRQELGDAKVQVLQIGPAGENQVRYASLMNMCNRACGRTGMGAVMGSKNLKAVAVRGNQQPKAADKPALKALAKQGAKAFPSSAIFSMGQYGTAITVGYQQQVGGLATRNFSSGVFDGWEKIDGPALYENFLKGREQGKQETQGRDTCPNCVVRCKRVVEKSEGPYKSDPLYGGPEYETLCTFGSYCGVDDLAALCKANEICNQYGLDTITCGAVIAWAMETFESGQLTIQDTGGLELNFGNAQALITLTEMIARREGFGALLAEGSQRAAAELSKGSEFLITGKGQEAPAHMPQHKPNMALLYAINPFGADHQSAAHDSDYGSSYKYYEERFESLGIAAPNDPPDSLGAEKVHFTIKTQNVYSLCDCICVCQFVWGPSWELFGPQDIVTLVRSVTGWDVTLDELLNVGARRVNLMRMFNMREGIGRERDNLAEKFFTTPLKGGPTDGKCVNREELKNAITEYYHQRGWDTDTGQPTQETLEQLELDWLSKPPAKRPILTG
ncbi:aldehyde ferredoxin oxidoreductase family protein [Desulfococcaceae bacterium HSG9]|nr:aldehyde ferredoxin oxidoreductase family protein [Desulfococcaceae bacterium HSG9]